MLTIATFIWRGERDYRAEHANVLGRMLARHMTAPFRLVAIADLDLIERGGFEVETMLTPPAALALGALKTPEGSRFPSSYRRLWLFSDEARCLGERVLLTDVDVVVTGDWAPLIEPGADFVGWRPMQQWGAHRRLAGGMWLLRTGTRTAVYDEFTGEASIAEARAAGYRGSDQAWISYRLASDAAAWPYDAGIYSIRDLTWGASRTATAAPPDDARAVHFNGKSKPWSAEARAAHPWVIEAWR